MLVESRMLPGVLIRNRSLRFRCQTVHLRVETTDSPFTNSCEKGQLLAIPIAHGEGCYYADDATLDDIEREHRVAFRYCTPSGELSEQANPNGSLRNIAGVLSEGRNVLGMMPHPERASDPAMGSTDGLFLFRSMVAALTAAH
jgi:phosphoribosylformylglycinamidine synthase